MARLQTPFEAIGERRLTALIQAKTPEARDIEYKRLMYGDAEGDVAECLADTPELSPRNRPSPARRRRP
jgi:hypothetical protein